MGALLDSKLGVLSLPSEIQCLGLGATVRDPIPGGLTA